MNDHTTTALANGVRVRLRFPHARDRVAAVELLEHLGLAAEPLELTRALRFLPGRRIVLCAVVWADGREQFAGFGAADLGADTPDLLLADERLAPGVGGYLAATLARRSQVHAAA